MLFQKKSLSISYKIKYTSPNFKIPLMFKSPVLQKYKSSKFFSIYTTLLTQSTTLSLRTHPSQKFFFIQNKKLNLNTFNLTKLHRR